MLKKYEGMFVLDPAVATDWEKIQVELGRLMERAGARLIASGKWDERRLAHEIQGRKRGVYALTYFEAETARLADIERDARLSEAILRCLLVRVDHLTEEEMKELAARPPEEPPPDPYHRGDGGDRGPRAGGGEGDQNGDGYGRGPRDRGRYGRDDAHGGHRRPRRGPEPAGESTPPTKEE